MRQLPITLVQILFVFAALAALFFVVRYNQNEANYQVMLSSQATFEAAVAAEATRQVQLVATQTYVESATYVEDYFRNEAGMVQPGERRVVPRIIELTPLPTPTPPPQQDTATLARPWQMWWRLLTDAPQPQSSR